MEKNLIKIKELFVDVGKENKPL